LVTSVLDGYNGCIFAYGQTGSGKTHTMMGTSEAPGVNIQALQRLFEATGTCKEATFKLKVSLLEVYNETVRDLLSDTEKSNNLEIRTGPQGQHCPDATLQAVDNIQDVFSIIEMGNKNRATASTNCNEHSSRSHCILSVSIQGTILKTQATVMSTLHLVDLAGSERLSRSGAEGQRAKEAQNINKSLSALGDVVMSLFNKAGHVPFRNSKLTFLLQDALGGNSKTLMMVQVSPEASDLGESLCTLKFAQRVRGVQVGQASKNGQMGELVKLKEEVANLKESLTEKSSELMTQNKLVKKLESKAGDMEIKEKDLASSRVQEKQMNQQLVQHEKQLSLASAESNALHAQIKELTNKLSDSDANNSELRTKYDEMEQKSNSLAKLNKELSLTSELGDKKCAILETKLKSVELKNAEQLRIIEQKRVLEAKRAPRVSLGAGITINAMSEARCPESPRCLSPGDMHLESQFGNKRASPTKDPEESPNNKSRRKSSLTPRRHSAANELETFQAWTDDKKCDKLEFDELAVPEKENSSPRVKTARARLSTHRIVKSPTAVNKRKSIASKTILTGPGAHRVPVRARKTALGRGPKLVEKPDKEVPRFRF